MGTDNDYIKQLIAEKAKAEAEKNAIIAEFTKSVPAEWTPDDLKEKLKDLLAKAYARISVTIDDDENPSIAYKAAWDVMKVGMGQIAITDANDPNKEFMDFLKAMQPSDATSDKSTTST